MKNSHVRTWLCLGLGSVLFCASCKQSEAPVPSAEPSTAVSALKAGDSALRQLTKEQLAERLIQASGGEKLGAQIFDQIIAQFSQSRLVAPEMATKLREKVNTNELVKLIVPVYTKHLAETEMIEMIEFYETPTGKSVVSKLPLIAQESMGVGQAWGANLAQTVMTELSAVGTAAPGPALPAPRKP